jgi:hypothetical protein
MKFNSLLALCLSLWAGLQLNAQESIGTPVSHIAIAPYIQALSPDSIVILCRTDVPAHVWVEYGTTPELGKTQEPADVHGLIPANTTEHRIVLTNLVPGSNYWYRVCLKPITSFGPYKVVFGPTEKTTVTPLHLLPPQNGSFTAAIYNDLHLHLDTFNRLNGVAANYPVDFSFFNGDCLADLNSESQAMTNFAVYLKGAGASSNAAFFIRGNHETRGAYARQLPTLFAWPGDQPYFAFNAGPVRFLVLDCGEDKADDHREYSGLVNFESFRNRETAWLKQELKSPEWKKARWHVLVHHVPLYWNTPNGTCSQPCLDRWGKLLAKARIDLAINAHTHHSAFFEKDAIKNPYPVIVGGAFGPTNSTVMILQADAHELRLRVLNAEGKDAQPEFLRHK